MPIANLGSKHLSAAQMQIIDAALDSLINTLNAVSVNLTDEERVKYGSIQEKNKGFINAVQDWSTTQPLLKSPDVDWAEFNLDFTDRKFADTRDDKLATIVRLLTDFKIVHDYDNYQDALTDYDYTKYKSTTNALGYSEKHSYLKQFFGGGASAKDTGTESKS